MELGMERTSLNKPLLENKSSSDSLLIEMEEPNDVISSIEDWEDYKGLTEEEAVDRLARFGRNVIEDKQVPFIWKVIGYFITPMALMMEVAMIIALA